MDYDDLTPAIEEELTSHETWYWAKAQKLNFDTIRKLISDAENTLSRLYSRTNRIIILHITSRNEGITTPIYLIIILFNEIYFAIMWIIKTQSRQIALMLSCIR